MTRGFGGALLVENANYKDWGNLYKRNYLVAGREGEFGVKIVHAK